MVDLTKPTGPLKISFMCQLVAFSLQASHLLFPQKKNQRLNIFQQAEKPKALDPQMGDNKG